MSDDCNCLLETVIASFKILEIGSNMFKYKPWQTNCHFGTIVFSFFFGAVSVGFLGGPPLYEALLDFYESQGIERDSVLLKIALGLLSYGFLPVAAGSLSTCLSSVLACGFNAGVYSLKKIDVSFFPSSSNYSPQQDIEDALDLDESINNTL